MAYNQVRVPGIVTLVMGVGNIILAVALSLLTGWGYFGVAAAGMLVLTSKNVFFTPWYATKVLGVGTQTYTRAMLSGIAATIPVGALAAILATILPLTAPIMLVVAGTSISLVYLAAVWSLGLSGFERILFKSYILSALRKVLA